MIDSRKTLTLNIKNKKLFTDFLVFHVFLDIPFLADEQTYLNHDKGTPKQNVTALTNKIQLMQKKQQPK